MDLEPGAELRMQRVPGGKWHHYTFKRFNSDGSLELVDGNTGGQRSISPARYPFEVKSRGPRGGIVWEALDEVRVAATG